MAKYMNVSVNKRIIKNYRKLLLYKMRKGQHLTHVQKQNRLDRAKILLRDFNVSTAEREIVFFSDEKLFTIKDYVNSQSYKVYAKSSAVVDEFVRTVYRRQKQFLLGLQSPNLGSQL